MTKARSPQYPAIGLKEAIDKVRGVYESDYQNAIPRALVASHMGYQGLNGKSLGVLSALTKFGLLEGRGDDTRVTDLAVQIIAHPSGTPERGAAISEAAGKPDLFKELEGRFPGKVSDQALRSYLLTQKFIPSAADAAIRSYRETKSLVGAEAGDYDSAAKPEGAPMHQAAGTSHEQALPPPAGAAADPYYFSFKPSVGFEGGFRLASEADFDALIHMLKGFKGLFKPLDQMPSAPPDSGGDS